MPGPREGSSREVRMTFLSLVLAFISGLFIGIVIGVVFCQPATSIDAGDDPDPGERKAA
jgi:hypothetical protein